MCKLAFLMGIKDAEDANQEALSEMLYRVHYHDSTKSNMLTWMHRCIPFALHRRKVIISEEFVDEPSYVHQEFVELEQQDTVQYILGRLSEYDQALLKIYYQGEATLQQIADVMGVSKGKIHRDIKKARCTAAHHLKVMLSNAELRVGEQVQDVDDGH